RGEAPGRGGDVPGVGSFRGGDGAGGVGGGLPRREAQGVRGGRQRQQLAAAQAVLRVVRAGVGLHPCVELRVRGGDGGAAVRRGLGVLLEVDSLDVAGRGGAGDRGVEQEATGGGAAARGGSRDERPQRGGARADVSEQSPGQDEIPGV